MYIGLVHATGSVSCTSKLIVCSSPTMLHTNSWPRRLATTAGFLHSFAGERRQRHMSEAVAGIQPHHSTTVASRLHVVLRPPPGLACSVDMLCYAMLCYSPVSIPGFTDECAARESPGTTPRLLSIATPPLSCVAAGGPNREHRPRCTNSYSYSYSV
jgi:hypothetical protein